MAARILDTALDMRTDRRVVREIAGFKLLNHGPEDGRPVTLYRGVAMPLSELDPNFEHTRIPGTLFFSETVSEPHRYAFGANRAGREAALVEGREAGTMLEVQVPAFAVRFYGHPVLLPDELGDLTPFIVRTAAVAPLDAGRQLTRPRRR